MISCFQKLAHRSEKTHPPAIFNHIFALFLHIQVETSSYGKEVFYVMEKLTINDMFYIQLRREDIVIPSSRTNWRFNRY